MDPEQIPIRGLHLPPEVGWWPLAPGWWVLIALSALLLVALARLIARRSRRNRARRAALKQLDLARRTYAADGDVTKLATRLSEILRRTMLAYAPRQDVAGLTGRAWVEWLDRDLDEPLFTRGAGRELLSLPYRKTPAVGEVDVDELIGAVRKRIRTPLGEAA